MQSRNIVSLLLACSTIAACSSGGGSVGGGGSVNPPPTQSPTQAPTQSPSTQQVISLALPSTAIGRVVDPAFGLVAGYTQNTYSQVLGFVPGAQVMIRNAQATGIPHTLGDTGASSFPGGQPPTLSSTATGSNTFTTGWQSGNLNPGQMVGPITLSAGTFFIGCAYHYASDGMRDVLVVAANATPGPQATQAPTLPTPQPTTPGGGGGSY